MSILKEIQQRVRLAEWEIETFDDAMAFLAAAGYQVKMNVDDNTYYNIIKDGNEEGYIWNQYGIRNQAISIQCHIKFDLDDVKALLEMIEEQ